MAWPAETISIATMESRPKDIPDELKITSLAGPDSFTAAPTPVIRVGSFTIWPLSYYDNRVSFGMALYDPCGCLVRVVEKPGARYVYRVTSDNGTVTVWGQSDQRVTLTADEIGEILAPGHDAA
jgi:hypothetical protein